jgi:DeoR family transcriptional regulator of aga operon
VDRSLRLASLLELLAERGQLQVDEIVEALEVSPATARRDLDTLAEQRLLARTRGGALSLEVAYDLPIRYKSEQNADLKQRIATAASAMVAKDSVVGLSGGTTSTAVASTLSARADIAEQTAGPALTIVTNAVNIASQLAMRPQIKTVLTGGILNPRSYELVGPFAEATLQELTIDIAFIGANGLDATLGPTLHNELEAKVNSLMARRAERAVIVADSTKIGKRAFASMNLSRGHTTLLTDSGITAEQQRAFAESGIEVIIADPPGQ